jgi:hypothetical protein
LKYKYSAETKSHSEKLLGISLELPSSGPSENDRFNPLSNGWGEGSPDKNSPLALWQAPNSNAVLYFGDKWVELHDFVSNRLSIQRKDTLQPSTIISKNYPAFMEYLLELSRARGYYILYPFFYAKAGVSVATVHNELYQPPEEHIPGNGAGNRDKETADRRPDSLEQPLHSSWTISSLLEDFSLRFPSLALMPVLSYTGEQENDVIGAAEDYAADFMNNFGDCSSASERRKKLPLKTDDLFCLDGDD